MSSNVVLCSLVPHGGLIICPRVLPPSEEFIISEQIMNLNRPGVYRTGEAKNRLEQASKLIRSRKSWDGEAQNKVHRRFEPTKPTLYSSRILYITMVCIFHSSRISLKQIQTLQLNHLRTNRKLFYLKTQFAPRSKHSAFRL